MKPLAVIIYGVNLALGLTLLIYEHESDSDKSIIISAGGYCLLIVLNLIFAVTAGFDKSNHSGYYLRSIVGLILLAFVFMAF